MDVLLENATSLCYTNNCPILTRFPFEPEWSKQHDTICWRITIRGLGVKARTFHCIIIRQLGADILRRLVCLRVRIINCRLLLYALPVSYARVCIVIGGSNYLHCDGSNIFVR